MRNERKRAETDCWASVYTYLPVVVISGDSQLYLDALAKLFIYIHDRVAY